MLKTFSNEQILTPIIFLQSTYLQNSRATLINRIFYKTNILKTAYNFKRKFISFTSLLGLDDSNLILYFLASTHSNTMSHCSKGATLRLFTMLAKQIIAWITHHSAKARMWRLSACSATCNLYTSDPSRQKLIYEFLRKKYKH